MNWVVTIAGVLPALLVGLVLYAMPWLTRPTIPLGVNVPSSRAGDPVVVSAVRRFRVGIIAVTFVAVLLGLAGAAIGPTVQALVPIVVELVGTLGVYLLNRRAIQRAKSDGDWYRDVPVRRTATITTEDRHHAAPALAWYAAGLIVLTAAIVVGATLYNDMPDPLPVHWNTAGAADRFAVKGIWSVFGAVLLGLAMVACLFLLAVLMRRSPIRAVASDSEEVSARIAGSQESLLQSLLGQVAFILALVFSAVALNSWLHPASPRLSLLPALLPVVLIALVIILFVVRYRRAMVVARSVHGDAPADARRRDAPDDDHYWKAGSIYVNRADSALLVPKRFGVGWTVNLGHPAGITLAAVTVLVVIGAILLSVTAGSAGSH